MLEVVVLCVFHWASGFLLPVYLEEFVASPSLAFCREFGERGDTFRSGGIS